MAKNRARVYSESTLWMFNFKVKGIDSFIMARNTLTEENKILRQARMDYAKMLFCRENYTLKQVAAAVGADDNTVARWSARGEWKKIRGASKITRQELVEKLLAKMNDIIDAEANSFSVDDLRKVAATIESIDRKGDPAMILDTFRRFNQWLLIYQQKDDSLSYDTIKLVNSLCDQFIAELTNPKKEYSLC